MPSNYGDVALGLTHKWHRTDFENWEFILTTVGHSEGVSDAYIEKDPEKRHQFYWGDPLNKRDWMLAQQRGYEPIHNSKWVKNDKLWDWSADGFVIYGGLVLMARPEERWHLDQKRRADVHTSARKEVEREVDRLPDGLVATEGRRRRQVRENAAGV